MLQIVDVLKVEEHGLMGQASDHIKNLMDLGAGYGLFTELAEVLDVLSGKHE